MKLKQKKQKITWEIKKLTATYVLLYSLMITDMDEYRIFGGKSVTFQELR